MVDESGAPYLFYRLEILHDSSPRVGSSSKVRSSRSVGTFKTIKSDKSYLMVRARASACNE